MWGQVVFDVPHPQRASPVLRLSVCSAPFVSLLPFRVCLDQTWVCCRPAEDISNVTGICASHTYGFEQGCIYLFVT